MKNHKVKHIIAGSILYALGLLFFGVIMGNHEFYGYALALPFIFGIGKECYDGYKKGHTADFWDFAATVAPGIVCAIIFHFVM